MFAFSYYHVMHNTRKLSPQGLEGFLYSFPKVWTSFHHYILHDFKCPEKSPWVSLMPPPGFLNKVLLEQECAHLCTNHLWQLSYYASSCNRYHMAIKPKHWQSSSLQKKFAYLFFPIASRQTSTRSYAGTGCNCNWFREWMSQNFPSDKKSLLLGNIINIWQRNSEGYITQVFQGMFYGTLVL